MRALCLKNSQIGGANSHMNCNETYIPTDEIVLLEPEVSSAHLRRLEPSLTHNERQYTERE